MARAVVIEGKSDRVIHQLKLTNDSLALLEQKVQMMTDKAVSELDPPLASRMFSLPLCQTHLLSTVLDLYGDDAVRLPTPGHKDWFS